METETQDAPTPVNPGDELLALIQELWLAAQTFGERLLAPG